jgi:hypothetical protein
MITPFMPTRVLGQVIAKHCLNKSSARCSFLKRFVSQHQADRFIYRLGSCEALHSECAARTTCSVPFYLCMLRGLLVGKLICCVSALVGP